jgi:hypothetical protein
LRSLTHLMTRALSNSAIESIATYKSMEVDHA